MALEIERKFLIKDIPSGIDEFPHAEIIQGYFLDNKDRVVRLRKKGDKYFQTTKSGRGLLREEHEIYITQQEFDKQWTKVGDWFLNKIRYEIPYQRNVIELDIYKGKLKGLTVAEMEFTSVKESKDLTIPNRFSVELTDIPESTNSYLAKNGISPKLRKLI